MATNKVDVDPSALDRQADRILAGAPAEEQPAGPEPGAGDGSSSSTSSGSSSWADITPAVITLLSMIVFPQWGFTVEEQEQYSKATADVLDAEFPGGLGGSRWAPHVRLLLLTAGMALSRLDPDSGKLPPVGPRREKPVGPTAEGNAAPAGSSQIP